MKQYSNDGDFRTSDFPLAVSLSVSGFKVEALSRTTGERRVQFCFKRVSGIEKTIDQYWKSTLMVNAAEFHNHYKMLKARLRNEIS